MPKSDLTIPQHIGFILDGNRRWAKAKNLTSLEGHRKGYETIKTIAEAAFERGIKYVSAYTFSTENWNRSKPEVRYLMSLILKYASSDVKQLHKKGIRFRWLGIETNLSSKLIKALRAAEELTKNNTRGTLNFCFNYGGQQEIADACNNLIANGSKITPESINKALYAADVPPLDFIVRTSGEHRLSNFMLWRAAYSELYFTKIMWPDFNAKALDVALADYALRQRRFGV